LVLEGPKAIRRKTPETKVTLAATGGYSYNLYMRTSRVAGLLFLATAAMAQHQQSGEITSEPSHHLVFQNEYVRVFDVTVAPRATTLVHKHNHDYLFVTLGDSDVVSVRPGEKPVALKLKDGEVRFTPGNFAHAAINQSDRPFHNITIELLKPSTSVKICTESCDVSGGCIGAMAPPNPVCPSSVRRISADGWTVSLVTLPPSATLEENQNNLPLLLIAVSDLNLASVIAKETTSGRVKYGPGGLSWLPKGESRRLVNGTSQPAQFVTLEFKPEQQKQ
jgi:quercetin dioxygenase-like cupin family protein